LHTTAKPLAKHKIYMMPIAMQKLTQQLLIFQQLIAKAMGA
jgi:hypothetical protein